MPRRLVERLDKIGQYALHRRRAERVEEIDHEVAGWELKLGRICQHRLDRRAELLAMAEPVGVLCAW